MEQGIEPLPAVGPTPQEVLGWVAAAGETWFPARHAIATGIPRDALDLPLGELRAAELVRVVDWVRGVGQGYALTEAGEEALTVRPPAPEVAPASSAETEVPDDPAVERPLFVTHLLVYSNLLCYFVGLMLASRLGHSLKVFLLDGDRDVLMRIGAVAAPELLRREWWRLETCCFVHGTIWHLLVNVVNLVMIGAVAEELWGRWRTFAIYLIAGFAGSCLAMALRPLDASGYHAVPLVGASGALWGLATAVVAWVLLNRHRLDPGVAADLLRRLGFGLALSIGVSFFPGISWEAHLGGAVAGFAAACLLHVMQVRIGWQRAVAIVLLAIMPATCLGGLVAAIRSLPSWAPLRTPPAVAVVDVKHLPEKSNPTAKF